MYLPVQYTMQGKQNKGLQFKW